MQQRTLFSYQYNHHWVILVAAQTQKGYEMRKKNEFSHNEQKFLEYKKVYDSLRIDYTSDNLPIIKIRSANLLNPSLFYPTNRFSYGMAILMRRKAFTGAELGMMRSMGFIIQLEQTPVDIENL